MPQIFRIGSYIIYFWVNEGKPIEPIHVHVSSGEPCENSTKIWITKSGKTIKQNNRSRIPEHTHILHTCSIARSDLSRTVSRP